MLRSWIATKFGRTKSFADLAPDEPFYAIGDIHGRFDLLEGLLQRLDPNLPVLCVGDYVDRGEESAAVLRFLQSRSDIVCLKGNHEQMLLQFLDNPETEGGRWLRYGGLQTLASFGVSGVSEAAKGQALKAASGDLRSAMGEELIGWVRALPLWYRTGNIFVTHAGTDPSRSLTDQRAEDLLWGHPDFLKTARSDHFWTLHGHTIVDEPIASGGRISIDTGAFATGRLTAVQVQPGKADFTVHTTKDNPA